jgi:hypothetical protein
VVARGISRPNDKGAMMVYRFSYVLNGTTHVESMPYDHPDDIIKLIRERREKGQLDTATIEEHNGTRIEWAEIKKKLEGSN